MRATLADGSTKVGPISQLAHGYNATDINLDKGDILFLATLDPASCYAYVQQLAGRVYRIGTTPTPTTEVIHGTHTESTDRA